MQPIWIIAIIITGTICLSIIAFIVYKTGVSINATDKSFGISGSDKKKKSPHASCRFSSDIILILQEQRKIQDEVFYWRHVGIIREQMNYAEQKLDQALTVLNKHFLILLKEMNGGDKTGISNSNQYRHYVQVLREVKIKAIETCRHIMRENHLADRTEDEFNLYEETKTTMIIDQGSDVMNYLYYVKMEGWPTREQIYDHNQKIKNELVALGKDALRQARKIAIEKGTEIEEKQNALDKKIEDLFT